MNIKELSSKILGLAKINSEYLSNISKLLEVNFHQYEDDNFIFDIGPSKIKLYRAKGFDGESLLSLVEVKLYTVKGEDLGIVSLSLVEGANIYVEDIIDTTSITEVNLQVIPEIDSSLITYPLNGSDVTFYQTIGEHYKLTKITIQLMPNTSASKQTIPIS